MNKTERIQEFIKIAKSVTDEPRGDGNVTFFSQPLANESEETIAKANSLLIDLKNTPHAFVLGCVMDRQIQAEKAWIIPYKVFTYLRDNNKINDFSIKELSRISQEEYNAIFIGQRLHRFNNKMASIFGKTIIKIKTDYQSNASNIWCGKPSSKTVVDRFRSFDEIGQKISTMATNILYRKFGIEFSEYSYIDISVDVHIIRVMRRLDLVEKTSDENAFKENIIQETKRWYPDYPGIFDKVCFRAGRNNCFEDRNPNCDNCILRGICSRNF
jgi:endonuclease III